MLHLTIEKPETIGDMTYQEAVDYLSNGVDWEPKQPLWLRLLAFGWNTFRLLSRAVVALLILGVGIVVGLLLAVGLLK